MRLSVIRHEITMGNILGQHIGSTDIPLGKHIFSDDPSYTAWFPEQTEAPPGGESLAALTARCGGSAGKAAEGCRCQGRFGCRSCYPRQCDTRAHEPLYIDRHPFQAVDDGELRRMDGEC